jgi:hypothetical protein
MENSWVPGIVGLGILIVLAGFLFAFPNRMAESLDDDYCSGSYGKHDERPKGCVHECHPEPLWYFWWNHNVCYWNDYPPQAS